MPLAVSQTRTSTRSPQFSAATGNPATGKLLALFFLTIFLPIGVDVAGMKLDPVRIFLLLTFIPFFIQIVSGTAGSFTKVDGLMLAFVIWIIVTLTYHHGIERFPYATVLAVEAFGGYLAGRLLIRSVTEYKRFIRYYLIALLLVAPFAVYELYYSRMPLADLFRGIFTVIDKNLAFRYGLSRVQVAFPHSILFGLFCSLSIASTYYIYRNSLIRLVPRMALLVGITMTALSSGPMVSMFMQIGMIVWGQLTKDRWLWLIALVAAVYIFLELASNRGAVVIFIETMTMNPQSGHWRIQIWNFGSASVVKHPLMGIGLNSYERPAWLTPSVDNFWLLTAMRHGLPGLGFMALAIGLHMRAILRLSTLDAEAKLIRKGYMITLVGLIFTLSTVFIWGSMNVMTMFFIGAGAFLYTSAPDTAGASGGTPEPASPKSDRGLPLSRFSRSSPAPSAKIPAPRQARSRDSHRPALPKATRT